ncbi:MAG TPA: hypothetical protein VFZ34_28885 [Blastocatellia bacterium]|nr:hypothetical protein [Blastocatellia bacterium]
MKVIRRIEIVAVREQTYRGSEAATMCVTVCGTCEASSAMVPPDLAASLSGLHLRTLFRWIESGDVHFVETPEGNVFLCLNSVQAKAKQTESEVVFSHGSCTTPGIKKSRS